MQSTTNFSRLFAFILLLTLPFIGFGLGMGYQKNIDLKITNVIDAKPIVPSVAPMPKESPNRRSWNRYQTETYIIDYPSNYSYFPDVKDKRNIMFEKIAEYPHVTSSFIFIDSAESSLLIKKQIEELSNLEVGQTYVLSNDNNSEMAQFNTYIRLSDIYLGNKKFKSFVNKKPWEFPEGTKELLYFSGSESKYVFGGFVQNDTKLVDTITELELKDIISTITFLDK